jgi:hypothetical protein
MGRVLRTRPRLGWPPRAARTRAGGADRLARPQSRSGGQPEARARGVQRPADQPWRWSAMEALSRQRLTVHGGDRRRRRTERVWAKRLAASRQPAPWSTAQEVVSDRGMPAAPPRAISPRVRHTPPGERCHTTRGQRVARVVRAALSSATTLAHHSRASTLFLCHDNLTRAAAEREHSMDSTTWP